MSFPSTLFPEPEDSERALLMKMLLLENQSYIAGGTFVSGTALTNPPAGVQFFNRITAISTATFTTLSGNIANANGMVLAAGTTINGRFTAFQLSSGSVVAYYGA